MSDLPSYSRRDTIKCLNIFQKLLNQESTFARRTGGTVRSGNPISHIFWEQEAAVMARVGVRWINAAGHMSQIQYIGTYEARPRNWHIDLNRFSVPPGATVCSSISHPFYYASLSYIVTQVQVLTEVMWGATRQCHFLSWLSLISLLSISMQTK